MVHLFARQPVELLHLRQPVESAAPSSAGGAAATFVSWLLRSFALIRVRI